MTESQKWLWVAAAAASALAFYALAPVLAPFAAAAILAYIGNPLVERLARWRLSRTWAVVVVFLVLALLAVWLLLVLVPMLERQIVLHAAKLPAVIDWLQYQAMPWVRAHFGLAETPDIGSLKGYASEHWQSAGGVLAQVLASVSRSGLALLGWLANLLLLPVAVIFAVMAGGQLFGFLGILLALPVAAMVLVLLRYAHQRYLGSRLYSAANRS